MLTVFLSTALLAATPMSAASPVPLNNPLAQAEAGFEQCYQPDQTAKTCGSIASYRRNGDGTWANTALVALSPRQPITLETVSVVRVNEAGAVCGQIIKDDVMKGKLALAGQPLPDDKSAVLLARIADSMAPLMGKDICTTYLPDGAGFIAKATIDGKPANLPDQKVIWIRPEDGYTARLNPQ